VCGSAVYRIVDRFLSVSPCQFTSPLAGRGAVRVDETRYRRLFERTEGSDQGRPKEVEPVFDTIQRFLYSH